MGMLNGKVAFITGAASGIGAGVARRFSREGAKVALADVMTEQGEALCSELEAAGHEAIYMNCDVSSSEAVEEAVGTSVERFGKIDVVFANAGVNGVWAPIEELQPDEWDCTLAINLRGTYSTTHYGVPHLKRAGAAASSSRAASTARAPFRQPEQVLTAAPKPLKLRS